MLDDMICCSAMYYLESWKLFNWN